MSNGSILLNVALRLSHASVKYRFLDITTLQAYKLDEISIKNNLGITMLPRRFLKSTKQIATLGPASSTVEMIEKLFLSGADVFRLNFSHGEHSEKAKLVDMIREVEKKYNHPIAILGDLQGPKLRVGMFADNKVSSVYYIFTDCGSKIGYRVCKLLFPLRVIHYVTTVRVTAILHNR
jgi:hypothetical protein